MTSVDLLLTQGKTSRISLEDVWALEFLWSLSGDGKYACRMVEGKMLYLHREILKRVYGGDLPPGTVGDHINGDGLDNTRPNLRAVSQTINLLNQRRPTGVSFNKQRGKWRAYITVSGATQWLGHFLTEDLARQARADAEARLGLIK